MSRTKTVLFLVLLLVVVWACASKGGKAVTVVHDQGFVRGCSFLGRVVSANEDAQVTQAIMQNSVAEVGGDTLLILPAGAGEAWDCSGKTIVYSPPTAPTQTNPITGAYPTPAATPRY